MKSDNKPKLRRRVELVIVNNKGHVLLGKNPRHGTHQFPGGGIERGSVNAAARREAVEETGIAVKHIRGAGRRPDVHMGKDLKEGYDGLKTYWRMASHAGKDESTLGADNDVMTELKFHHPADALALVLKNTKDRITPERSALLRKVLEAHKQATSKTKTASRERPRLFRKRYAV